MHGLKKLLALALALAMVMSLGAAAFAADEEETMDRAENLVPNEYSKAKVFDGSYGFGNVEINIAMNDDESAFYIQFFCFNDAQIVEGTVADGVVTVTFDRSGFMGRDAQDIYDDAMSSDAPWLTLTGEAPEIKRERASGEPDMSWMEDLPGNAAEYSFANIEPMDDSPLAGKDMFILGSSVAFGMASQEEAVGEYLAARFDCTLTKEAVGGTTLTDNGEKSYVQRMLNNMDTDANCDLFICQLSTNDASAELPLGEISDSKELDAFDTATITGAMEYIICYAQKNWDCPVVFFTGSRYDSDAYGEMVARVLELKDKWGIGVLDLWSDDDFNDISDADRELYMNDNIHPTKAGYSVWWGPELESQLLDFLAE